MEVTITAASPTHATAVASRLSGGIGIASSRQAVDTTLKIPTTEAKTASRPNWAGVYIRVRNGYAKITKPCPATLPVTMLEMRAVRSAAAAC